MTVTSVSNGSARLQFYGGLGAAVTPLVLFTLGVVYVTMAGMITMRAYFAPLVIVVALVIVLAKDKKAACEAMLTGVADRTLAVMIFAFLGAGVLGQILVASGVIKAVVWLGYIAGVEGTLFVLLAFAVASIVSTATGTSTGTCVTCVPILYPAGVVLGAHPALLLGAIYSGARFGDNLAPISDTTVASAYTQGAQVGEVVRTRLKYALAAAGASVLLYSVLGPLLGRGEFVVGGGLSMAAEEYAQPRALAMLLAPALTIYLCVKGRSLIHAIWYGILSGMLIGLVTGSLTVSELYHLDAPRGVGGAITDGITSMRDVIFLAIFIMGILGALREAGALEVLVTRLMRFATTVKRAELAIFSLVAAMCPLTASNTPAMLFCGPVVKDIGERFGIHRTRRANLMDLSGNGITENLPHINTILALAGVMIASHDATGAPLVPITTVGLLAFHPMMLTGVGLFTIATGWGARQG